MLRPRARTEHRDVREIVPSDHCIERFLQRGRLNEPGIEELIGGLTRVLEDCDISAWPPAWAVSERSAELWAATADLAFPLARTPDAGVWLALTCLRKPNR